MIKAVIYARYSCDNQREESIEGQLRECKEFATRKGYTLVGSYIDRAMSAKTDNRPEFQRMIKESAKELFDVVIVWKLDRFARNRYDSAHYKATLRRNGVKVVSATEVISEGAEGIILESVLEGYAEYYSAELSEKVIRGMTENALKCQYNGGYIPVGYKVDENKHYQIDELTAPFVKEAFLMYVNGRHIKKIVEYFNENGIRSSRNKPMTKTTVSTILQNRKYIGEYQYRDIVVSDGIPAIISRELFALAQQRTEQNKYAPSASRSEIKYLLTGKLMCGDCGSVYAGESGTGRTGQKYHYYKCVKAKKRDGCERKAIKKDEVEEAVIEATVENIFVDEVIEEIADRVISWQEKESTLVPLYQRELAEVEKSIANLLSAIEQGIITSATKNRMAELESLKIDLEVKIAREEIQTQILTKDQVKFWLKNMEKLDLASIDNRQRIINTFVNSIYVYEDRFEVNFNCREGFETIPLDIERFVSRLEIVGEPKQKHTNRFDNMRLYGNQKASGITSRRFYFSLNKKSPALNQEREKILSEPVQSLADNSRRKITIAVVHVNITLNTINLALPAVLPDAYVVSRDALGENVLHSRYPAGVTLGKVSSQLVPEKCVIAVNACPCFGGFQTAAKCRYHVTAYSPRRLALFLEIAVNRQLK